VTYGIFPALTAANTILNILGFVGALLLFVWAVLELKEYVTSTDGGLIDKDELKEAQEMKDKFQTLAGIKPHNSQKGTNDLVDVLMKAEQIKKDGFPPESESIPVNSFPITKIKLNEDSDPLASVPMSRVSKAAKQKMAEIAKQDITARLEETAEKYATLIPEQKKCGCGRSETGYCTGLHTIPKKQWETGMTDLEAYAKAANPATKPKRKYKKKPKA
jgi:hypothetical protein